LLAVFAIEVLLPDGVGLEQVTIGVDGALLVHAEALATCGVNAKPIVLRSAADGNAFVLRSTGRSARRDIFASDFEPAAMRTASSMDAAARSRARGGV
jgi:hypothetical protein